LTNFSKPCFANVAHLRHACDIQWCECMVRSFGCEGQQSRTPSTCITLPTRRLALTKRCSELRQLQSWVNGGCPKLCVWGKVPMGTPGYPYIGAPRGFPEVPQGTPVYHGVPRGGGFVGPTDGGGCSQADMSDWKPPPSLRPRSHVSSGLRLRSCRRSSECCRSLHRICLSS
jgi:hypothetical protein